MNNSSIASPRHPAAGDNLTLPFLLAQACDHYPNAQALHQWTPKGWKAISGDRFHLRAELIALGLTAIGVNTGERVAMLLPSDLNFSLVDMGCLIGRLVSVPLDLTQTIESIIHGICHSQATVLVVANGDVLAQLADYLWDCPQLHTLIVADVSPNWEQQRSQWLQPQTSATIPPPGLVIPETACLYLPAFLESRDPNPTGTLPNCLRLLSLAELETLGATHYSPAQIQQWQAETQANDLATILYIPDQAGSLEGVMLSQNSLAQTALAAFNGMETLGTGPQERALTFLPLTHIFARAMLYGHLAYGHSIYFSSPKRVMRHLREVKPTVIAVVPLFLEKIYEKLMEPILPRPHRQTVVSPSSLETPPPVHWQWHWPGWTAITTRIGTTLRLMTKDWQARAIRWFSPSSLDLEPTIEIGTVPKRSRRSWRGWIDRSRQGIGLWIQAWAASLAASYRLDGPPSPWKQFQLMLANGWVYPHWRRALGGELRFILCGGAPLSAQIVHTLAAAKIPVYQGYGLTQTSSVVCFNRVEHNQPGTVGQPLPAVEVAIAPDGEVQVRGPGVMLGYYRAPEATQRELDAQGWLHTGDLGQLSPEGFLTITGTKKSIFKLSTGKYVTPTRIEAALMRSPLIDGALVVGAERKYCGLLIVPNPAKVIQEAKRLQLDGALADLLNHPAIHHRFSQWVDGANCHRPYWSTVKRFRFVLPSPTVEAGGFLKWLQSPDGLTPEHRHALLQVMAPEIDALYIDEVDDPPTQPSFLPNLELDSTVPVCPVQAQSLSLSSG